MSRTKNNSSIGGWTRVLAERQDRDRFITDMNRIRELGSAFTGAQAWQHDTVYAQLRRDMSPEASRAVFGGWPTFAQMWDAA